MVTPIDFRKLTEAEAIKAYHDQFAQEETEILFFIEIVDRGFASLRNKESKTRYGMPAQWYSGIYHLKTDTLDTNKGTLEWVIDRIENPNYKGKLYNFEPYQIYHAKVRKKLSEANWDTYLIYCDYFCKSLSLNYKIIKVKIGHK